MARISVIIPAGYSIEQFRQMIPDKEIVLVTFSVLLISTKSLKRLSRLFKKEKSLCYKSYFVVSEDAGYVVNGSVTKRFYKSMIPCRLSVKGSRLVFLCIFL